MQQQELIPDESAEESRIADLKSRFRAMTDFGLLKLSSGMDNPFMYFHEEVYKNRVPEEAEANLVALEEAYWDAYEAPSKYMGDTFWDRLRESRDEILASTDWSQLADAPLTTEQRGHYREYRKYLRDLPTQYNDSSIHNWSIKSFDEWKNWKYPQ